MAGKGSSTAPVIVAGMHRSGTSLVASFLAALGVDMGDELLARDRHNPNGYFEDIHFLDCQRQMLRDATRGDDGGHRDWGWTESESLDATAFETYRDRARALVMARDTRGGAWGWKDPRSSLLLDFWQDILGPERGRFVLIYRHPWDVADSMQRLGADVFLRQPEYAYRIWAFYNRHLLQFYRRHRERAILVSAETLIEQPQRFAELLHARLGLELRDARLDQVLGPASLFTTREATDPLIALVSLVAPGCIELLARLDADADLARPDRWVATPRPHTARAEVAPPTPRADGPSPGLSVVTPCRNDAPFLIEAIASVERCASSAELIVVDDGSDDPRTIEILQHLETAGYRVLHQAHQGLAAARNHGFAAARGPYVLPLDADNRLRPGFVSQAIAILDARPEVGVVYGDRHEFGLRSGLVTQDAMDLDRLLTGNYIDACAVVRKSMWSDLGGYDTNLEALEDWELWIAAAARGWQFQRVPGPAFDYRVRPDSLVTRAPAIFDKLLTHIIGKHARLLAARVEALSGRARELTADNTQLSQERSELQVQFDRARQDTSRLSEELAQAKSTIASAVAERELLTAEREALTANLDLARQAADRTQQELARASAELERMRWSRSWRWTRPIRAVRTFFSPGDGEQ